jgi:8-oxo-dGTP pyrophosphatase MutT (NUDIX family)
MRSRLVALSLKALSVMRTVVMFLVPLRLRAVKAAIRSPDGKVLLVRHSYGSGAWMLPGGLVRRREPFASAARREVREELGIDIEHWTELAVFTPRLGLTTQRLGLMTAVVADPVVVTNDEIAATVFVDPSDPPPNTSPATARRLAELDAGSMSGGAW